MDAAFILSAVIVREAIWLAVMVLAVILLPLRLPTAILSALIVPAVIWLAFSVDV